MYNCIYIFVLSSFLSSFLIIIIRKGEKKKKKEQVYIVRPKTDRKENSFIFVLNQLSNTLRS